MATSAWPLVKVRSQVTSAYHEPSMAHLKALGSPQAESAQKPRQPQGGERASRDDGEPK